MPPAQVGFRLGLSPSSIKSLCAQGKLAAFKTEGGHWRVLVESVEAYLARAHQPTSAVGPSSILRDCRERVEHLTLKAQELRAHQQVDELEQARAQRAAERKIAAEAQRQGREQELEQHRREQQQRTRQEKEQEHRHAWLSSWYDFGLDLVPRGAPEAIRLDVCAQVKDALSELDPDESTGVIESVVRATIGRLLAPWLDAQVRARREVWLKEQLTDAWSAMVFAWPWRIIRNDQVVRAALDAELASVMKDLAPGCSRKEEENARRLAVEHVLEPYRREQNTQRAIESGMQVVKPHLRKRHAEGLLPPRFDSQDLALLARLVEPKLRSYLEAEGRIRVLTEDDARQLAQDFIDTDQRLV